jgi:LPS-assembly protein
VRFSRLSIACMTILFAAQSQAQSEETTWNTCKSPELLPLFQPLDAGPKLDPLTLPTDITADAFNIQKQDESVFEGDVELQRGPDWLGTETLRYNHTDQTYRTDGLVRFQNRMLRMTAQSAQGDTKADTIELTGLQYQFHESNANGTAEKVTVHGSKSQLTQASFSTCPSNQKDWQFAADEITINSETNKGVARNARLKIGKVPIFWMPYLQFPTDNARASGLLSPTIGQDNLNGLEVALPYYFNLAPNYDATLTPRFLSQRGFMLESEFRYLFTRNRGEFNATYLPDDDIRGDDRYLLEWTHFTGINRSWYFASDLNHSSDVNYFSDFGNSISETSTSLLKSELGFYGRGKYWNLELSAANWEIANPTQAPGSEPYRRLPRLAVSGIRPFFPWLEIGLNAEAVAFSHDQLDDGNRLDIEPYVKMPFKGAFWYVTPGLSWRQTEYWLKEDTGGPQSDSRLSRGLSIFSIDAGASFERAMTFADQSLIQTLEPRLFYLNVPYRNQDDIPVFDTQTLTFMWPSLFRDNRYGGADRQTDANQLTTALTTRFLDSENGKERMNFSVGRITYFDAPKVTLPGEQQVPGDGSDWVAEANVRLSDQWQIGVTQHWDPSTQKTSLSSLRGYWSMTNGTKVNASYRYSADFAEQTDLAFVVPINADWRALGRWTYSLRDRQNLESMLGFEWKSCCLALRVFGRKYIRSFDSRENLGIFIELELNGIGQIGSKPELFEENGILAY